MCIHAEHASLVPIDDGIGNLSFSVTVSRMHAQHLGPRGNVLRDGSDVIMALEDRRVIVQVQDRYRHRADGGEGAGPATIHCLGLESVQGLELTVKGRGQAENTRVLVNRECSISRIQQRVHEFTVRAWADTWDTNTSKISARKP